MLQRGIDIPVAIFSLGEQSMFLPISECYEDTLRWIVKGFDLEEDVVLSLRTSTMNACRGREVVIPGIAYTYLWKYLDEVDVSIVGQAHVVRRHQMRAQEKSRAIISPIAPEYPSSPLKDIETEAASSTVIHAEAPLDEVHSHTPIPDDAGRGSAGSSKVVDMTEGKITHSQKSKNADDEHRLHSDDQTEVSQEKAVHVPLKIADLQPITEPDDSGESIFNSQKKFKPAAAALFSKSNKEIGSPVTVKKEILAEPGNEESFIVRKKTLAHQPEDDPRFEITIISPQNETAQFKTRGKHPVRKVLAAACKNFGIKYERARLVLCVSTEEGGEIQTDEFDCPAGETMSQCGVDGNAKLFVKVQPDLDDEEYEED